MLQHFKYGNKTETESCSFTSVFVGDLVSIESRLS